MYAYYHNDCTTCKNYNLYLVEGVASKVGVEIDQRLTIALPDIWGVEAKEIGEKLPFLYNIATRQTLHIDHKKEGMKEEVEQFLTS